MNYLIKILKLFLFKKQWRRNNKDNSTYPVSLFPLSVVDVGKFTYGGINVLTFGSENKLHIGSFCSIGPEVLFVLKADHYTDHVSTFPFKVKALGEPYEAISKGDIILDNDVWIGCRATILSGVHIGQGAVISAGAVVTKDVPPYAIVGGVPAKVIKNRFSVDIINELEQIDFDNLDYEQINKNIEMLYKTVDDKNLSTVKEIFKKNEF